jgi:hypothetical protein
VQSALGHGVEPPGIQGKHTPFDPDCELQILDWIRENAENSTRVTKTEMMNDCMRQFQLPITRSFVNSFVLPHADQMIQRQSVHREE